MKKKIKMVAGILVGLFILYTFYLLWAQSQPKPDVYSIVSPENRDIELTTVASGTLEPRNFVELKPQITGTIQELHVKAGDAVHVGDIVALLRVIPDMSQLNSAQSNVESARIELEQIQRDAERSSRLFEQGVISREENEQQQNKLSMSKEKLLAAQYQVDVIKKGFSARSAAENTTAVRCNMDGIVLDVPVKVGTVVSGASQFSQGTTIAKVGDMSDVIFNGNIDEADVAQLHVGMEATVVPGSMPDVKIPATLEYIAPEGNSQNGAKVYEVHAAAHVPEGVQIRSGYSVNAFFILEKAEHVMSVDESCVTLEDNKPYVYKLVSDPVDTLSQKFERVPVEIGLSNGLYVQIKNGVEADMKLRSIKK